MQFRHMVPQRDSFVKVLPVGRRQRPCRRQPFRMHQGMALRALSSASPFNAGAASRRHRFLGPRPAGHALQAVESMGLHARCASAYRHPAGGRSSYTPSDAAHTAPAGLPADHTISLSAGVPSMTIPLHPMDMAKQRYTICSNRNGKQGLLRQGCILEGRSPGLVRKTTSGCGPRSTKNRASR